MGFFKLLKNIFKPFLSLGLGFFLLMLGILWAAWVIVYLGSIPAVSFLGPTPGILSYIGSTAIFCAIGIPIIWLMLLVTRWFSSYRLPSKYNGLLKTVWSVSMIASVLVVGKTLSEYSHESTFSETYIHELSENVLEVNSTKSPSYNDALAFSLPHVSYTKFGMHCDDVDIEIRPSDTKDMKICVQVKSHGKDKKDAQNLAKSIDSDYEFTGSELILPTNYKIERGDKYRGQELEYILMIPIGQSVKFDKIISRRINHAKFGTGSRYFPRNFRDYTWTMSEEGLVSEEWNKNYKAENIIKSKGLENINIDVDVAVHVQYGKKSELKISGPKNEIERIKMVETNNQVSLMSDGRVSNRVKIEVVTPKLSSFKGDYLRSLKIEGFEQKEMEINYRGNNNIDVYVDVENLSCVVGKYAGMTLIGSGKTLNVNSLDGASRIKAGQYKAEDVELKGFIARNSTFYASNSFKCPKEIERFMTLYGQAETENTLVDEVVEKIESGVNLAAEIVKEEIQEANAELKEEVKAVKEEAKAIKEELKEEAEAIKEEIKQVQEEKEQIKSEIKEK